MKLDDFFHKVNDNDRLEGAGIDTANMLVKVYADGVPVVIGVDFIERSEWGAVEGTLLKQGAPLSQMSRVVGYYSKIEDWNQSKIGELKDRQKGNYEIADKN